MQRASFRGFCHILQLHFGDLLARTYAYASTIRAKVTYGQLTFRQYWFDFCHVPLHNHFFST